MSKALVIKGADFSTNAVTTISFGSVPCEGITFASDTITITSTDSVTVEYTLTPSNTTDTVTWASSDTTVVSVSGGVLTVNGIGIATLTATCGEYTATATVTVSISYLPHWEFRVIGYESTSITYATYGAATYNRLSAFGTGTQATNTDLVPTADHLASPHAVKLPGNTARVRVSVTNTTNFYNANGYHAMIWLSDTPCGDSSYPNGATKVSYDNTLKFQTDNPMIFTVPDGADSFVFMARTQTTADSSSDPDEIASGYGLTIEFLEAE